MLLQVVLWMTAAAFAQAPDPRGPACDPTVGKEKRDRLRPAFLRIVEAAQSPEFAVWYSGPGFTADPLFVYCDQFEARYDCAYDKAYRFHGLSPASTIECRSGPVITVSPSIFEFTKTTDEWAFFAAHEIAHVLLQHSQKTLALIREAEKRCPIWAREWLQTASGKTWLSDPLRLRQGKTLAEMCLSEAGFYEVMRENEADADHWAMKLVALAGFKSEAGKVVWQRINELTPAQPLDSHYPADIRALLLTPLAGDTATWVPPPNVDFDGRRD